jgi:acyl-coenzyme A synthetase/AMP-(fatty) acid ligase/thioesterase domain-containing protein
MLHAHEDTKSKLIAEIAKFIVENTHVRNYMKDLVEVDTVIDPVLLVEIKTLAQRIDIPDGLLNTLGATLLEKAVNYLKSSIILETVEDEKLQAFLKIWESVPAPRPRSRPSVQDERVLLNVSGSGNNCGLFAMVLGIKIALENQRTGAPANKALEFLGILNDECLQHETRETIEVGRMLRTSLATALKSDDAVKARRFEAFISYCAAFLEHANFSRLDTELESLYKANKIEMTAMYDIWAKEIVGKGIDELLIADFLTEINSYDVTSETVTCYQQISALLIQAEQQNLFESIKTLFATFYSSEEDPISRLIQLKKLYRAAWERVRTDQASETQRQVFNEVIRKYFIQCYITQLAGKRLNIDKNRDSLLILSIVESMQFDANGNAKAIPSLKAIISTCRGLFAELQVYQFWASKFYPNYCHYIDTSDTKITADELACLAQYWNVQLSILMSTGVDFKTYTERNPNQLYVSLTNPSRDHWIVIVDKESLKKNRTMPASSSTANKVSALSPMSLPLASSSSAPSSVIRGVFDITLTQPISNAEFDNQIYRLANFLKSKHPSAKRVALFMQQSVDYMRCFFALHHVGMAPMPISPDTDLPPARLAGFITGGQVDLIISLGRYRQHPFFYTSDMEARQKQILFIDELSAEIALCPDKKPDVVNSDEDLAYIVNTSGSTGVPKQVLVPHRGLKDCTDGHIQVLNITAQDNIAAYADPAFDAHIIEMLMQRKSGASLFVVPADARRDLIKLTKFYQNHRITIGVFVASMLRQCKRKDFPDLRVVICTGEKIDESIIKEWSGIILIDGYGPAENTIATWLKVIHSTEKSEMFLIPNTQYFIMQKEPDAPGLPPKLVKAGEEGELYLAGHGLAIGYTNAELSNARFVEIDNPKGSGRIRVYKTRDIAKENADGTLDIVGRLDRQVKVYGRLFYPEAIEEVIKTEMAIKYLHVDAFINAKGHPEIIAYLEYNGSEPFDIASLYQKICTQIGQTFAPTCWVVVPELPKLSSDKVDSKKLSLLMAPKQRVHGSSQILPQNDLEKQLIELFYEVLDIPKDIILYRDDNFFHLGGKSLHATVLLQKLRTKFELRSTYDEFKLTPTVEQLAHAIMRVRAKTQLQKVDSLYVEQQEPHNAPIILIHSLLGDAARDYEKLKAVWNYPHSLYIISARGLQNPEDMDNNLYALAYDYYKAIKEKFPRGLKIIAGWSMGGILAAMIKYFFQLYGDDSAAVLMIDSESPTMYQAMSSLAYAKFLHDLFARKLSPQLFIKNLPLTIDELAKLPKEKQIYALFGAVEQMLPVTDSIDKKGLLATIRGLLLSVLNFQLDRRITNVKMITASETQSNHNGNGELSWPLDKVNVELLATIAGNHDSIMLDTNNVRLIAEHLQKFCKKQQDEFLAHRLANNQNWEELLDIDDENLKYYIPAMGARNTNTKPDELLKLVKSDFLSSPSKKVLLMLGEAGVGKTTFLGWLAKQLQKSHKSEDSIVLYIPLANYENTQHGLIEAHLRRLCFSDTQIVNLKKHQKFIFILDGYDEIDKDRYQNLYATNHLDEWNAQVIVGCRSSYLINAQNYREIFYPIKKDRVVMDGLSELTILPFNDSQIIDFIKAFLKDPPEGIDIDEEWRDYNKYLQHIDSLPGLRQIIRNPFLLRVLMEVLPDIVKEYEHLPLEKRLPVTQSKILDAFVARCYERAVLKLMLAGKRSKDGRDIRIHYDQFSIDFAKDLKLASLTYAVYRPTTGSNSTPSPWEKYFGSDPELIKIREGCLIKRITGHEEAAKPTSTRRARSNAEPILKGEIVGFSHPLLIEYYIGRGIYLEFLIGKQPEEDQKLVSDIVAREEAEAKVAAEKAEKFSLSAHDHFTIFSKPENFSKAAAVSSPNSPVVAAETARAKPPQ